MLFHQKCNILLGSVVGERKSTLIVFILVLALVAGVQLVHLTYGNFFPDPGPDLPRIYIKNDGTIEPANAPIERTGNFYKLTDNIMLYTIEIQRNNIILNGSSYLIQGNASWMGYDSGNNGILITGRENITLTNFDIVHCYAGIRVTNSSNISITNNNFINGTTMGIIIKQSSSVIIENNKFTSIYGPHIHCTGKNNTITGNTLIDGAYGIELEGSSNIISNNRMEVLLPIILDKADWNIISWNNITGPEPDLTHWPDREGNYTGNEGLALYVNCSNNMIFGNNITGFANQAIRTVFSCSNNIFYGNYMANNDFAIAIQEGAINNTFYGNTFAADSCKIQINEGVLGTLWNNGTIGNYWGDYNGTDNNGDGIGDTPYTIIGYKWDTTIDGFASFVYSEDNYPLMEPFILPEFHSWFILPLFLVLIPVLIVIRNKISKKETK
jgi:parallel beta-helix repeat protein